MPRPASRSTTARRAYAPGIRLRTLLPVTRRLGSLGLPGVFPLLIEPLHARAEDRHAPATGVLGGIVFELDPREYVQRRMLHHAYEPTEARLVRRLLRPGDLMLDVGANIGFFALQGARAVGPAGKVLAVEPVPANADRLARAIERNALTNVELVRVAAGAEPGEASIGLESDLERGADSASGHYRLGGTDLAMSVRVEPLDGLVADHLPAGSRIRLVKIDVEGHEADALRGFERTLAEQPPDFVLFEVNPTAGAGGADAAAVLERAEYTLFEVALRPRPRRVTSAALPQPRGGVLNLLARRPGLADVRP